uniref:Uncharacterized protein n=1 Tax=Oryza punctata TaxID=4537 RepID=A0A0E0KN84_ORYPU
MPKPNHSARSTAGGGGGGPIDADWKYFLDNVREEGHSYSVRVPADGANPSYYLHYEKSPTNGAASTSSRGGAGRKRRRMEEEEEEEEEESSSGEPALHVPDPDIEEDYRVFLQNVRLVGNGGFVLEHEGNVIRYDASGAAISSDESSDESVMGAPEPNPRRRKEKFVEEDQEEEEDVKNVVAVRSRERDFTMVKEDQEKKGKKVVDLPARGEDGAMAADSFHSFSKGKDDTTLAKNVKDKKDEKEVVKNPKDKKDHGKKEVALSAKEKDGQLAEGVVIKVEEEDEQLQIVPAVEKLATTTRLTNLSDGHKTAPRIASGSHGVIWPIHINDREESDFKQRLIHALNKPFSQGEYDKLFCMATIRNPLTRERRTRCGVKYYYSQHEKAKSYFDCYPDLAKQVQEASYPNRLALLRGLFFWLENIGQEDQFRPWRGDHKRYKIVSL